MQQIKWGMIGCGAVTEVKSGPAFYKCKGSSLVAVMRRNADKARDYASRHGVARWYDDADKLIADPDVDAVYIATPPDSHCPYTLQVAAAGKPIYVEKPMGRNHAECTKMIDACEKAGVPLFVAYYRRALPNHVKVKRLVDSGAIGDVRFVNIRLYWPTNWQLDLSKELPWRVDPEIAGGGYFFDLASHTFDFLDFVLGPVTEATGSVANQTNLYPAEDIVAANFEFASGVLGSGVWCFSVDESSSTEVIEIVGSKGRITFHSFGPGPVRLETAAGTQEFEPEMPEHVHQPLVQTVVDELLGRGKCPSTGISGARSNWILDEIVRDWRSS
jgi:predicted dehydrogenase